MFDQNPTAKDQFELVSTLADEWRLTPQAIYQWIAQGRIPAYKLGRRTLIKRSDAQRFLEENATSVVAKAA